MTVAASTHNRSAKSSITLGDGTTHPGVGYGGPLTAPLVLAGTIPAAGQSSAAAALCGPGTLDPAGANGKIVVCDRGTHAFVDKGAEVDAAGGAGIVVTNVAGGVSTLVPIIYTIPGINVETAVGDAIKEYIGAQTAPTGTINATEWITVDAPSMASFSSYGPALAGGGDLLKPDITAPGVDVIAAYSQDPASGDPRFESLQGTSMSAPHIAGLGALLKQKFPTWSPMAIKSAMMTTARQTTDEGEPIAWGSQKATPLNYGAGEVVPAKSYNPGIVYDSNVVDWYNYACGIGQLQLVGGADYCAEAPMVDPSDLNYPSISVGDLAGYQEVTRTVTNVTSQRLQFKPEVEVPAGFTVNVTPKTLTVPAGKTAKYKVEITRTTAPIGEWAFGSVTWVPQATNGKKGGPATVESARSPIAIRPVAIAAPDEVVGTGTAGSTDITVTPGFTGTLATDVDGLLASTVGSLEVKKTEGTTLDGIVFFDVAAGTRVTRIATYDDQVAADDIDLYVYRLLPGNRIQSVGSSGNEGSSEEVTLRDLAPGTYVAAIDLYSPEPTVTVPLHLWDLDDTAAGNLTVDPASVAVTSGTPTTVKASWTGLEAGQKYLGQVNFVEGGNIAGSTLVTVNT